MKTKFYDFSIGNYMLSAEITVREYYDGTRYQGAELEVNKWFVTDDGLELPETLVPETERLLLEERFSTALQRLQWEVA